jgi:hypothetical protein
VSSSSDRLPRRFSVFPGPCDPREVPGCVPFGSCFQGLESFFPCSGLNVFGSCVPCRLRFGLSLSRSICRSGVRIRSGVGLGRIVWCMIVTSSCSIGRAVCKPKPGIVRGGREVVGCRSGLSYARANEVAFRCACAFCMSFS